MYIGYPAVLLLVSAGLASALYPGSPHDYSKGIKIIPRQTSSNRPGRGRKNSNNGSGTGAGNAVLQLAGENIQNASSKTGQEGGGDPAQVSSLTDSANFINFCNGKTKTNGQQVTGGSCNGIPMGDIPSQGQMVSTIIISPQPGQVITADMPFDITVQIANLVTGSFTNPQNTYYSAPQTLSGGVIVGHTHVTVQDLGGSLTPSEPPDAKSFVFFKGVKDTGDGNGLLIASVSEGLPAGNYRVCTITSASNHQPVLMPVAQRGAQDDCTKFTVGAGGNAGNGGASGDTSGSAGSGSGSGDTGSGSGGGNRNRGGRTGKARNTNGRHRF